MVRSYLGVLLAFAMGTQPSPGVQPPSVVSVTRVGKPPVVGRIASWNFPDELVIAFADGNKEHIDATDVDSVQPVEIDGPKGRATRTPTTAPDPLVEWIVQWADGSRIVAEIAGGDDENLLLRHAGLGEIAAPIEQIDRLWRPAGHEPPPAGDEDVVELANGDRRRGAIAGAAAGILRLAEGGHEEPLAWDRVQSVALAAAKRGGHEGLSAHVHLSDGSFWVLSKFMWKDGDLRASLAGGANLDIPLKLLERIEINGGRRAWLSDLPPEKYESKPYVETRWAYQLDKNVLGGPLALAGRAYRRGIGLHSACHISWRLAGGFERFTALVGIDDSAGPFADADVTIRLDDRELVALKGLHVGDKPRPIDLLVAGGDRLTIEIGFGKRGDVQDRVDVVNPALIRK